MSPKTIGAYFWLLLIRFFTGFVTSITTVFLQAL
nr:MAG TPA: hypothetical protein [Caudoviricetes sp.]